MTRLKHRDAEEYTDALGQVVAGAVRLTDLAQDLGVPQALGMTLEEWTQRRLAGAVRLSINERKQVVEANPDKSSRELGKALGVDHATVLNDRKTLAGETSPAEPDEPAQQAESKDAVGEDSPAEPEPAPEPAPESAKRTRGQLANASQDTDEWETPQDFFNVLHAEFGFDLDVCAFPWSAKCERYFAPEDDGLAQDWSGVCWMNPPYGEAIVKWVAKAHESAQNGATVVCLVPARTDTGWWWDYCRKHEIRFLRGRLKFGGSATSAPFPSAVVVMGRRKCVVWWEWR
jgi:phage N-6-adenine-methyltransferase